MTKKELEVSLEELNCFEYFLEQDNLPSWVHWNGLQAKLTVMFPELAWYFNYQKKLAAVKELLLMQIAHERSIRGQCT